MSNQNEMRTIEVKSRVVFRPKQVNLVAKLTISLDLIYDQYDREPFETIKEKYFEKLEDAGISRNRLVELPLEYMTSGYRQNGTIYSFTTESEEEMLTFFSVKHPGTDGRSYTFTVSLSLDQVEELANEAIKMATEKAKRIAAKTGKNIGEIVKIVDNNGLGNSTYHAIQDEFYEVNVVFELV